jgi:hypothetical protein
MLELAWSPGKSTSLRRVEPKAIHCEHEGHAYAVRLKEGRAQEVPDSSAVRFVPGEGGVVMDMSSRKG